MFRRFPSSWPWPLPRLAAGSSSWHFLSPSSQQFSWLFLVWDPLFLESHFSSLCVFLSFLLDSHFKCLVLLGSSFIFKSEPLKANRSCMQRVGLLNDDWIETQYFVGGHPRCQCLYIFTLGIWVSPERSLPISSSGVDTSGHGSGNSVRVRAWGSHYSVFRLSLNHLGNTCFQPLFSLNLGTLSGLKIKDIFRKARFWKQIII